jgi:4-amino-4-deoxy-L-arabinose transferase-like glycosyltransferase
MDMLRERPDRSDRELARVLGCSRSEVRRVREGLLRASSRTTESNHTSIAFWERFEFALGLVIVGFALALRIANYLEIKANDPYFSNFTVDPRLYHEWAIRICNGDWMGAGSFHLGPLYPYVLGVCYAIFGSGPEVGHLLNVILGTVSVGLIWLLARDVFGWRSGLVAALLAAAYPMLIYSGCDLVLENVQVPLNALVLLLLCRALSRPRLLLFCCAGLCLAMSALARPNVLLYVPCALACIALARREGAAWRTVMTRCAAMVLGVAVGIAPITIRNWLATGDVILVTDNGGLNFYVGNNPDATGYFNPPGWISTVQFGDPDRMRAFATQHARDALGHEPSPSEVSAHWRGMAWSWMRGNPADALTLLARKAWLLLSSNEFGVERQLVLDQGYSWVLRLPAPGFEVVVPLALLGMVVSRRPFRCVLALDLFVLSQSLALVLFFISDRYRVPMAPAVMALAGAGGVWLVDVVCQRRWWMAAGGVCCVALMGWATIRPLDSNVTASNFYNLGNKLRDQGKFDEAVAQYRLAIEIQPRDISPHNNLALILERIPSGRAEAVREWELVWGLARDSGDQARLERAERHLKALGQVPRH